MAENENEHRGGGATPVTLAALVRRAADLHGDRPALIGPDRTWTHREVDAAVASVAAEFLDAGLGRGDHVVLLMHKTTDSFVVIHAVLRIGAVIVPADPLMPAPGLSAMLSVVRPHSVIVDQLSIGRLDAALPDDLDSVLLFSPDAVDERVRLLRSAIDTPSPTTGAVEVGVSPDDPAYVIFTSGSTGVPKGITHTHRSGLAYARLAVDCHGIEADDRLAGLPPLHFDMSTLELYAAPLAGAAVVPIGTAELRFPATFTERSADAGITMWYAVPFHLRQVSERGALHQRDLSALRHVIYAGESFPASALATLMAQLPGVRFTNAYGPAETNVVTIHELTTPPVDAVPIGLPWGDVEAMVIDPERRFEQLTPDDDLGLGHLGELVVRAPTMMRGYLARPDLTDERTIGTVEPRWYRTGDLVRREADGVLWMAGRIDHQVKVRGTRLELEAIEAVLTDHPEIVDAVVAPDRSGPSIESLVAAVVVADGVEAFEPKTFRRWCSTRLPTVAVPVDITVWSSFPLTSSGKIDRGCVRRELETKTGAEQ